MLENNEKFKQIIKLLMKSSKKNFEITEANFDVGKLISDLCEEHGEDVINNAASMLNQKGIPVSVIFLFDALRVFKSIRNGAALKELRKKLNGNLRWSFLVNNCTRAPEGDSEEALLYWEQKLSQIENALEEADRIHDMLDRLPQQIREQVEGLMLASRSRSVEQAQERTVLEGDYRIGHMADMQVDDSFTVAGRVVVDQKTGMNDRLLDINRCISSAVEKMIEAGCRACLVAGDATETPNPSPNVQRYLLENLTRLAEHMPVFIEPGNHGLSKNPKDSTALEFLKGRENIFVVEEPAVFYQEGLSVSTAPSPTWPQKDCAKIFVLPFPSKAIMNGESTGSTIEELNRSVSDKLRVCLHSFRSEIDHRVPNILMTHITVTGAKGAENAMMLKYDPALFADDLYGFDYVALGHIHEYQKIEPNIYYSGSIDRMDFNEEGQPKGFLIVTVAGREHNAEFVQTPARTFITIAPDFFSQPDWKERVESKTVYRIKGEVSKEAYEDLKPFLNEFPVPILNKLTVRREVRIRDEKMTEDLKEEDAIQRYLAAQGVDGETTQECLQTHNTITSDREVEIHDTPLFTAH